MPRPLALTVVLLLAAPLAADDTDWTGKTVKLKSDNLKTGTKFRGGLVRDGVVLDGSKTYVVKSDDGSLLELVGQTGFIFKLDADVVAGGPAAKPNEPDPKPKEPGPKPNEKGLWPADTKVLPKKRPNEIRFGDRDRTGRELFFELSGIMPMIVRKDLGDGWVRIHDGHREGWVRKDDLVTREDASVYWDRAVRANPRDTWALYMRGNGWWQKGEPDTAIKDFTECIRLDPADPGPFNSRGNAWRDKKEYDKAVDDFNAAIRLDPRFAIAFNNRGNTWRDKKEYDKAVEDFNAAIRLDPNYAPAHINRGLSWVDKKEFDKGLADYAEAIRLDPRSAAAFYHRGAARLALKEYEKALADFNVVLQLDPKWAAAVGDRAVALSKLKRYEDAATGFEAALKLDPADRLYREYALFRAACPEAKYRDGKRAVELAAKAVEKAGTGANWEHFAATAAALAEAGEFDRAVAEQQKALADKALDPGARKNMEARLELYRAKKPYRDE
jgi:tetratricopeptide (TPR) repeat protein